MATDLPIRAWASALALALHNAEEILGDLPAWSAAQPSLGWMSVVHGADWFTPTAIALVILAFGFALWASAAPGAWMVGLVRGFALIMLVNAASHVLLSVLVGSLMPGTVTALLVLVPVQGWIALSLGNRSH